jgi:E3 ubiquitin-protein ligase TRIP12
MPDIVESDSQVSKILRLLRVVHNLCMDTRDGVGGRVDALDESLFVNNKLTAKLTRQLEETMIIASGCLPDWAEELPKYFAFLFPFEVRYAFLRSTSFGYGRLIAHWQASQPRNNNSSRRDDGLAHVARLGRQKVRISRSQLLESCVKVLELYGKAEGILEVEYFDEIGTGLGPTLEFYAMASKEFARRSLKLWRDEDDSHEGVHVWHPHGLFPAPLKLDDATKDSQRLSYFKTLGVFVGRALLDSRIIDLNFNRVFLKMVLSRPIKKSIATLKLVDAPLARSLERLQSYLQARHEIEELAALPPSTRRSKLAALTIGGAKLHDLSLDFTLPGYDIELKPGGRSIDVDDSNLAEYIDLVLDLSLASGVSRQVQAFRDGFSSIFSVSDLQIFAPDELALLCGNAEEDWSQESEYRRYGVEQGHNANLTALEQAIKADHGYNSDSRVVRDLIDIMTSYSKEERRAFLQFMTGAPKLPLGGFKGLNPQFTVVRKPHEAPFKADDYLPSGELSLIQLCWAGRLGC